MTLTNKMAIFLKSEEKRGVVIGTASTNMLLLGYYESLGTSSIIPLAIYLNKVKHKVIPAYGSVTRAIRKCRQLNPSWRKPVKAKAKHVASVKEEVGY